MTMIRTIHVLRIFLVRCEEEDVEMAPDALEGLTSIAGKS
jgi:hypothetical protein